MEEPHSNLTLLTQILVGMKLGSKREKEWGELEVGELFLGLKASV